MNRWVCSRPECDGNPHPGMHWCAHPLGGPHEPDCRHARWDQHLPQGEWHVFLYHAGRGSGKTRAAAEAIFDEILAGRATRIALVGRTPAAVRDVMVDGESGLLAVAKRRGFSVGTHEDVWYVPSMSRVRFNISGRAAMASAFASTVPDALRGPNFDLAWADEPAAWEDAYKGVGENSTWSNLELATRIGSHPARIIATTTPRRVKLMRDLMEQPGTVTRRVSTLANEQNLAPSFVAQLKRAYGGTRLERQELLGEVLTDVEGALWSYDQLDAARRDSVDMGVLSRVVVGVDPAGTKGGDVTGVVVVGRDRDGHGYVLEDASGQLSPADMVRVVQRAADKWQADRVVAEGNYGGDMVREVFRGSSFDLPVDIVHASRGKRPRAEPAAMLSGDPQRPETWADARLHLVGSWPQLEDELTSWTPESNESPGRLDALVWALHGLKLIKATGSLDDFLKWIGV